MCKLKKKSLIDGSLQFLDEVDFPRLVYYRENALFHGTVVKHYYSLVFLLAFSRQIFQPKMHRELRILHISGDFYKEDNRIEFADAYNLLNRTEDLISGIDVELSPSGIMGSKIAEVLKAPYAARIKRDKVQDFIFKADQQAAETINTIIHYIKQLMRVLNGILYGEVAGEYDTITNLGQIAGRENQSIIAAWKRTFKCLEQVLFFIEQFTENESKKRKDVSSR